MGNKSFKNEDEIKELRENADKLTELRETFREEAERSVKATFIIDTLALAENIKVDENEVMQTIYYEAMQTGQDPQKAYEQMVCNYHRTAQILQQKQILQRIQLQQ